MRLTICHAGTDALPMEETIGLATGKSTRERMRGKPKGRVVEGRAADEIAALLGNAPRRRDLLIEYLHRIQDRYGHISAAHIVALAREMKLAMTEVYEVATFYHHFDVVKEGAAAPPPLTVRVCDSLSCELAGAGKLMAELRHAAGAGMTRTPAPAASRTSASNLPAPASSHANESHTRTVSGGGAAAPSFTTSKW